MSIIPSTMKDLMSSPSAQESPDLTWDYDSQLKMLAQSVTWRGKHTHVKSLRNASKKATWIPLLCGRIYEPLTASRGVERWIALSAGIHANHSQGRDSAKEKRIPAICGHGSPRLSPTFDRDGASSRTSADIYLWGSQRCARTLSEWGSALRRACSRRAKLAQVTDANDSSSWRTPTVTTAEHPGRIERKEGQQLGLEMQANTWRTPTVSEAKHQTPVQQRENSQLMLQDQMRNWPTPRLASGITSPLRDQMTSDRETDSRLEDVVSMWPTPDVGEAMGGRSARGQSKEGKQSVKAATIALAVQLWLTPTVSDFRGSGPTLLRSDGKMRGDRLDYATEQIFPLSRQDQTPLTSGEPSSKPTRTLNPRFVEWLMGLPQGWTSCGHLATESFRRWLQEHS